MRTRLGTGPVLWEWMMPHRHVPFNMSITVILRWA